MFSSIQDCWINAKFALYMGEHLQKPEVSKQVYGDQSLSCMNGLSDLRTVHNEQKITYNGDRPQHHLILLMLHKIVIVIWQFKKW